MWGSVARIVNATLREHHRAPLVGVLLEEPAGGAEAGVREDGVDSPEAVARRGGEPLLVVVFRNVAALGECVVVAELLGEVAQLVLGARREHDLPARRDR